ncbi:MAG TPA: hypothetical protein VL595_30330 [Pseudonocardia sp.]|jgi:hypothetical protein|nr:hypothetical protein [Pseudonocardia sp.]
MPIDLNWLISLDDHVLEPPNVWQDRMPQHYLDAAPRIVSENGAEFLSYDGNRPAWREHLLLRGRAGFFDVLPTNPVGKVLEYELRARGVTEQTWDREKAGYEVTR